MGEFFTENYHYSVIDAPGHRDFIKNMISGAAQADVGVLMVPADGNFVVAIQKGDHKAGEVQGQTRQHARLINLLGVKQLVVCVNKMDEKSVNYSQDRFNEISEEVSRMIKEAGYHPETVPIIPVSGFEGDNLLKPTEKMPWYNGWSGRYDYEVKRSKKGYEITGGTEVKGKTLVEALNNYMRRPNRDTDGPLRISISDSKVIGGIGLVTMGRVEVGTAKVGDEVSLARNGLSGKIFSIEMHHQVVPAAVAGYNVGMVIKFPKGTKPKQVRRGDLLFRPAEFADTPDILPRRVKSFKAAVKVQNHPGQLKVGFEPQMCVRTGRCASRITKIHWVMGKRTGMKKLEDAEFVQKHEMAEITFEPQGFLYLEPFTRSEAYGRVAGMESKSLVMMGKILDVTYD